MSGTDLPDHLSEGPTIDEADFIFSGYSSEEVTRIHQAVTKLTGELDQQRIEGIRYLILGNYDEQPKQRLEGVRDLVEYFGTNVVAFLLSDLDSENSSWDNFYIKFRYTLSMIDYSILVAEDNDGGHELELGEVPLSRLYVLKRAYGDASIEADLEYEKFDAMIAKLFEVMAINDQLYRWQSLHELARGTESIVNLTDDSSHTHSTDSRQTSSTEDESMEEDKIVSVGELPELPQSWTVEVQETMVVLPNNVEYKIDELRENPPDIEEFDKEFLLDSFPDYKVDIVEEERWDEISEEDLLSILKDSHTWVHYTREVEEDSEISISVLSSPRTIKDGFRLEASGRNADEHHVAKPIMTGISFSTATEYAQEFTKVYESNYQRSLDGKIAFEQTIEDFEEKTDSSD